jgi:hypothetical protein
MVSRMGRRFFLPLLLLVAFLISATSAEAGVTGAGHRQRQIQKRAGA